MDLMDLSIMVGLALLFVVIGIFLFRYYSTKYSTKNNKSLHEEKRGVFWSVVEILNYFSWRADI